MVFIFKDKEILWSWTAWLNDRIMDVVEKLICKKLGADDDYQSVLNVQKRRVAPFRAVKKWIFPTIWWWFWTLATFFL